MQLALQWGGDLSQTRNWACEGLNWWVNQSQPIKFRARDIDWLLGGLEMPPGPNDVSLEPVGAVAVEIGEVEAQLLFAKGLERFL